MTVTVAALFLVIGILEVMCFTVTQQSQAIESVPISTILKSPETYSFRDVTLHGVVREVNKLEPFQGRLCVIYDAYTFVLDDETGSIEVEVGGTCHEGQLTIVKVGQSVTVNAHISRFTTGSSAHIVKAVANNIMP